MPKKIYKSKSNPADEKQNPILDLTQEIINIADKQDFLEDSLLKLTHKQERLQHSFENLISVLTENINTKINNHSIKTTQFVIDKTNAIQHSIDTDIKFLKQDIYKEIESIRNTSNDALNLISMYQNNIHQPQNETPQQSIVDRLNKFNNLTFIERLFSKI